MMYKGKLTVTVTGLVTLSYCQRRESKLCHKIQYTVKFWCRKIQVLLYLCECVFIKFTGSLTVRDWVFGVRICYYTDAEFQLATVRFQESSQFILHRSL